MEWRRLWSLDKNIWWLHHFYFLTCLFIDTRCFVVIAENWQQITLYPAPSSVSPHTLATQRSVECEPYLKFPTHSILICISTPEVSWPSLRTERQQITLRSLKSSSVSSQILAMQRSVECEPYLKFPTHPISITGTLFTPLQVNLLTIINFIFYVMMPGKVLVFLVLLHIYSFHQYLYDKFFPSHFLMNIRFGLYARNWWLVLMLKHQSVHGCISNFQATLVN